MTEGGLTESERVQKAYYDRIAGAYDRHFSNEYALKYRYGLYDSILLDVVDFRDLHVLDAMCGGGQSAGYFTERRATVTGIDISCEQCGRFALGHPESAIVCGSILDTGFPDSFFDMVVTDSLHHLHPDLDNGIGEILRILKPGGYFLIWEPSANSIMDLLRRLWYRCDNRYFAENERSIDLDDILGEHGEHLHLVKKRFGGNVAYLFVQESLPLGIPPGSVRYYAPTLMAIENAFNLIQSPLTSCWVLALMKKRRREISSTQFISQRVSRVRG